MAIVVTEVQNGSTYISAHSDIMFTAYEATKAADPVTYEDYKYVCDIYVNGVVVTRLKAVPEPVSKHGLFNISSIIRGYLETVFDPAFSSANLLSQVIGADAFYVSVQCKFGEEYAGTLYTNLTVATAVKYYNTYNKRGNYGSSLIGDYVNKFLTTRPMTDKIEFDASYYFLSILKSSGDIEFEIKTYTNTLVDTQAVTLTPSEAGSVNMFNFAPQAINDAFPGLITYNLSYYTVTLDDILFRLDLTCNHKYTTYAIHFLNQLGTFETFFFRKVSRLSSDIERKEFTQPAHRMSSTGVVTYANANGALHEQSTIFAARAKDKLTLNSDLLTDAEHVWIKQLILSPMVYLEENGQFRPVRITNTNYEERRYINDKLTNLVINIDFSDYVNAQYR